MFKALILIDNDFVNDSIDLVEVANQLAGEEELCTYGLGINLETKEIKGFDSLICVDIPELQLKDSRVLTDIVEQIHTTYKFDSIILLATDFGRMTAPRIAMRLKTGLTADITSIEVIGEERRLIRPAFSGNMLASIICDSTPIMASVHPNVFHMKETVKEPKRIDFLPDELKASSIEVLLIEELSGVQDIREAKAIVSAGAGFQSDVNQLKELAEVFDGAVAASKPLVEAKRAPREIQVGQSGKTVSPSLYIALGIYGSMQHVEGLKNVKDIISVNIDEGAPMNYLADLVVIGDAAEFAERLTTRVKR
ncbi:electron transfer flavoprotein subunit alpha/FixB family protein [Enterococcus sp. BWR-S5]|uniref:electron transfer flavoprotein subunit alpha/FixB family protein n=1 Tax=Enterococcus sp. BWR-S5 TaxID=2787714 RepID=UPI001922FD22|nr:electron transfer flavoprotein subunit alpha/FixB family protein [Enterococcus sp. BWR-S5]MBL1224153.1 electron transfer flavoprotein subunit alpha/FixB family protein [Enterococcus sp. BWR-S5]